MKNSKLIIKTSSKNYPIYFGNNILFSINNLLKKNLPGVKKICVIADNNLPKILLNNLTKCLKKYDIKIFRLSANEKNKNLNIANRIIENLLKNNFNRSDCVIAFGGGMIGDLSAFVSNLTKRGLKFINIPTTLLAQVDASIGGKTAVNSVQGKNLIGTFYQPDFVISDINILKSLPKREMISGYGEILKHSLILDKKFFLWLCKNGKNIINKKSSLHLKEAIIKSCRIKSAVVNKDEKEKSFRMILNFGHTFAHGFERTKNFSKKLNHGEAVLLGMIVACKFSNSKKLFSYKNLNLIKNHYIDLKLPKNINNIFKKNQIDKIIYYMKKDKKNINEKINLILLNGIGSVEKFNRTIFKSDEIKKFLLSSFF